MTCYRLSNSTIVGVTSGVDSTCSIITDSEPYAACCPLKGGLGNSNLCLNDFLCWESKPPDGGSGYLTASCTDESYESGECTPHCTDQPVPDVVYNAETGLWHCCGRSNGTIMCSNPTDETFEAPAPDVLTNSAKAATSTPGSPSGTSSATSAATTASSSAAATTSSSASSSLGSSARTASSMTAPSSSPSSAGLSTGAEAGVGVGVALGVVAIIALGIWYFVSRPRKQRAVGASVGNPDQHHELPLAPEWKHELHASQRVTPERKHELHASEGNHAVELPSGADR